MSQFNELLDQLEALQKAAGVIGDGDDDTEVSGSGEEEEVDGGDGGDDNEEEGMGKSMLVQLADGQVATVFDAEPLLKSIESRVGTVEGALEEAAASRQVDGEVLGKALSSVVAMLKSQDKLIREQAELIKSMREDMGKIANQGRGRKSVISINERPSVTGSEKPGGDGIQRGEVLAKANAAMHAGRITGMDLSRVESYLNNGLAPPADVMARVDAA